ncbi:chaperonin 10-like protein [Lipomyces kononenkoae]|uniref:Chaperonin 10-like protein n=1 Tax=Lipomyces kononenkoae TaxID=34357 RepID=A0ACC3T4C0_LIPKO
MKEVIVHPLPRLRGEIREVPIPIPADDEVVIKVVVAGSNVKDWSHITALNIAANSGDDIAGVVYSMGTSVQKTAEFRVGDRVAAFHRMLTPGGAYAEYAVAPAHTTFIIPHNISFEEAATLPLVTLTAAISLFRRQGLPPPWDPLSSSSEPLPLIVYGASSALGAFAIKLARLSNIHPIIAICGASHEIVDPLLDFSQGDRIVDYRKGIDAMKASVKDALGGLEARHAFDAISSDRTWVPLAQILHESATSGPFQVSVVTGANRYDDPDIPSSVDLLYTYVGVGHYGEYKPTMPKQPVDKERVKFDVEFAFLFYRYLSRLLARGNIRGHPFEVIPGGLAGVEEGLNKLKNGEARGIKYVYRVSSE